MIQSILYQQEMNKMNKIKINDNAFTALDSSDKYTFAQIWNNYCKYYKEDAINMKFDNYFRETLCKIISQLITLNNNYSIENCPTLSYKGILSFCHSLINYCEKNKKITIEKGALHLYLNQNFEMMYREATLLYQKDQRCCTCM
jgi:hypothetical protein